MFLQLFVRLLLCCIDHRQSETSFRRATRIHVGIILKHGGNIYIYTYSYRKTQHSSTHISPGLSDLVVKMLCHPNSFLNEMIEFPKIFVVVVVAIPGCHRDLHLDRIPVLTHLWQVCSQQPLARTACNQPRPLAKASRLLRPFSRRLSVMWSCQLCQSRPSLLGSSLWYQKAVRWRGEEGTTVSRDC